ncbi:hypothetical protein SUNI508_09954 [Seiridium unicorne]|uniref:ShKT domain-containing protein n=1 Tax=Seiridium unicorne TaxID=138068 RepID=A0ABR2UNS8_9PEZI
MPQSSGKKSGNKSGNKSGSNGGSDGGDKGNSGQSWNPAEGGGGGYWKYRCKYMYTHNCPNWTYVYDSTCAACAASGRD